MAAEEAGDAALVARLFARDPAGTGLHLRAPAETARRFLASLAPLLAGRLRICPAAVTDDRLWGGLDLAASLSAGGPVRAAGLLAQTDGGVVALAGASRLAAERAARLAATLETGRAGDDPARIGLILLDDGLGDEPPQALLDRISFRLTLEGCQDFGHAPAAASFGPQEAAADDILGALCGTADALGIASPRAGILALRAAHGLAALEGRSTVTIADAAQAARLVLAHRATRLPADRSEAPPDEARDDRPAASEPPDRAAATPDETLQEAAQAGDDPTEIVLQAVGASLPPGLLAGAAAPGRREGRGAPSRGAGRRGRPLGARPGKPGADARLALLDTLRAAAPWQRLRAARAGVLAVRSADLRVRRFASRTRTTTIFAVDASGSAALNRLAEAKGAVELLLAQSYVRRDHVALIGFRGRDAALLLPPTGALTRAKRSLAALPGGGGTPLAAGLDAALALAGQLRRRGEQPHLVVLTDGRANVARDGTADRARARDDALARAALAAAARLPAVVIDISPLPSGDASLLAARMGARFLALPRADAGAIARAARAA